MAEHDQRGGERDRRQRPRRQQPVADVAGRRRCAAAPSASARHAGRTRPTSTTPITVAASATATSGINDRTGDGSASRTSDGEHDLHELPGGALPRDGPQAAADVAHVAPVADAAVNVADDPAGERQVEEQRPVVGRDGSGQRQADAEAAGHDRPPPGTADGGQQADGRRGRQRRGRRPRGRRRGTGPRPGARRRRRASRRRPRGAPSPTVSGSILFPKCSRLLRWRAAAPTSSSDTHESAVRVDYDRGRHGSTSRSAWSTVTASCPARACARRRPA